MTGHMTFLEDTLLGQPDMTMMEDPVEKSESLIALNLMLHVHVLTCIHHPLYVLVSLPNLESGTFALASFISNQPFAKFMETEWRLGMKLISNLRVSLFHSSWQ